MTKAEFLAVVDRWSAAWDAARAANQTGFGSEVTLDDWLDSVDCFAELASRVDAGKLDPAWIAPMPGL